MRKNVSLSLLFSLFALAACDKASSELIPCMCDSNADSTLGLFDCMCEPSKKKPVRRISYLQDKQKVRYQSLIIDEEQYNAYAMLHKSRDTYAPIKLENVDFRIKKSRKYDEFNTNLGNYHFRLFGCRRETKNAFLNQGRTMQKDMHFFDVFYETLNDYYPVVVEPSNVYYPDSDKIPQAEYLITAEITDYFMNMCDEFDWNEAKSRKLRSGSSEITVVWRIMNIAKDQVFCRGTTTGYGQVMEGEPNGENLLIERAFEDALTKLPEISCVDSTLAQRVCPADIEAQLAQLRRFENNVCETCFQSQYEDELRGIEMLQSCSGNTPSQYETQLTPVSTGGVSGRGSNTELVSDAAEINEMTLVPCEQGSCLQSVETAGGIRDSNINILDNCQTAEIIEDGRVLIQNKEKAGIGDDFFVDIPLEIDAVSTTITPEECERFISEDGGVISSGMALESSVPEECIRFNDAKESAVVECEKLEQQGVLDEGGVTSNGIVLAGGTEPEECVRLITEAQQVEIFEDGSTTGFGSSTNVAVNEINESAFASVSSQFCIINNPPFEDLNPHNLYKLRASVVSVKNASGKQGAGLIIADNLVLTSADLIEKDNNLYDLQTVNGKKFKASAFRVNPSKNVAVLLLDKPTTYQPLPMSLTLPEVNKDILLTIGLLNFDDKGENYIDNEGRVVGYRWSEDRGAEIIVDTFVQTVTLGGALIDQKGNIIGIAHETKKSDTSPDLFIPIETALKSLGLEICGQKPARTKPKAVRIYTPIADAIDQSPVDKSPKPVSGLKRK